MTARQMEADRRSRLPLIIVCALAAGLVAVGCIAAVRWASLPPESASGEAVVEEQPRDPRVEEALERLTPEQRAAQLFIVRPEDITGVGCAVAAGDATRMAISSYPVGGLIYFAQNLEDPDQVREMIRSTQNYAKDACGLPMFISTDEEGGSVVRIADNPAFGVEDPGDMADVGATGDVELARASAERIGRYLRDLGFNLDFAPVADIATSPESQMARRSFGSDADLVSSMAASQIEAFGRHGILACAKHFPGIGGATLDSHEGQIVSVRTLEEMDSFELAPFRAAIEAGCPVIMVGHLTCAGIDDTGLPASIDPAVVDGILRRHLGYEGLVVTDALEMGAVSEAVCPTSEQAVRAIEAGCDLVLCPTDFHLAYQGLLDAVASGRLSQDRVDESCRRIIARKLSMAS